VSCSAGLGARLLLLRRGVHAEPGQGVLQRIGKVILLLRRQEGGSRSAQLRRLSFYLTLAR